MKPLLLVDSLNAAQCQFMRMRSSGFTDVFDERIVDVSSEATCEQNCLNWSRGTCRSFTYHRGTHMCFLSHASARTLSKKPVLNYNQNLSFGDLEDCMQCLFTFSFSIHFKKSSEVKMFFKKHEHELEPK